MSALQIGLVEDNNINRLNILHKLESIETVDDIKVYIRADELLEFMKDHKNDEMPIFDILVVDYDLHETGSCMNGLELCRELLNENGKSVRFPLVMLTGAGNQQLAVKALKAGVYDYIVKDKHSTYLQILPTQIPIIIRKFQAEQELKEKERKNIENMKKFLYLYSDIFVRDHIGVIMVNNEGSIEYSNDLPNSLFCPKGKNSLIGLQFDEIENLLNIDGTPVTLAPLFEPIGKAEQAPDILHGEHDIIENGEKVPVKFTSFRIHVDSPGSENTIYTFRRIREPPGTDRETNIKGYINEIRELQRELEGILHSMAHLPGPINIPEAYYERRCKSHDEAVQTVHMVTSLINNKTLRNIDKLTTNKRTIRMRVRPGDIQINQA